MKGSCECEEVRVRGVVRGSCEYEGVRGVVRVRWCCEGEGVSCEGVRGVFTTWLYYCKFETVIKLRLEHTQHPR